VNDQSATEVAQIERDLEILRARYALMARWARVARVFVASALVALAVALIGGIIYAFVTDIVIGLFIIGTIAVASAVWIGRDTSVADAAPKRPSQFYPLGLYSFGGWIGADQKRDAETIQEMIALRERRLAALKTAAHPNGLQ
jgi:hypothetical protein